MGCIETHLLKVRIVKSCKNIKYIDLETLVINLFI